MKPRAAEANFEQPLTNPENRGSPERTCLQVVAIDFSQKPFFQTTGVTMDESHRVTSEWGLVKCEWCKGYKAQKFSTVTADSAAPLAEREKHRHPGDYFYQHDVLLSP